jgi:hypothetical protein
MGTSASKVSDDEQPIGSGVSLTPELEGRFPKRCFIFDVGKHFQHLIIIPVIRIDFLLIKTGDIVRDFQSKMLQNEWNKFGTSVIMRRNARLQELEQVTLHNQQQRQMSSLSRQKRMEALDASIDGMQANVTDQLIAIEYDADKLIQKYGHWFNVEMDDPNRDSKPLPCLGERAHWIDCQTKYAADSRPCKFYVAALEQCVQRTLFGSSPTPE